jgi:Kef-type K+ transport system membrane component KefB
MALIFIVSYLVLSLSLETSLFLGAIISNSAIEVSSTVLRHTRFKRLRTLVVGASFVDDIMAVFVLGVVLTFVRTTPGVLVPFVGNVEGVMLTVLSLTFTSLQVGLFLVLTFFVLTRLSQKVLDRVVPRGFEVLLSLGFFLAFGLGIISKWIGLHEVIGVYIAGLLLSSWSQVPDPMMKRGVAFMKFKSFFTRMTESLFSPIFFGVVGIMLGSALVDEGGGSILYIMIGAITLFLVAIAGKSVGCGIGARRKGLAPSGALVIGVAMWGRGALELILIKTGLREGFISQEEFSMVVLMTMMTILITPLAYRLVTKWKEHQLEEAGL